MDDGDGEDVVMEDVGRGNGGGADDEGDKRTRPKRPSILKGES